MNNTRNPIQLFCFPYAGGSSAAYHPWKKLLNKGIELRPIELAGRGKRIVDELYKDCTAAVEDIFEIIKDEIASGKPYMLFGHSMGCIMVYELAQKIREFKLPAPKHIFFSGKGAVHIQEPDKIKCHLLNEQEFKEKVIELGGTPPEFFEYEELMMLLLPLLRNDFKVAETYQMNEPLRPFDQDITVFLGKEDEQTAEQREGWHLHTTETCHIHEFEGKHFFINDHWESLAKIIYEKVTQS